MNKFKAITHIFAVIGTAIAGFILTPAGQALIHQYPLLAAVIAALGVAGIYHNPKG